MNEMRRRVEKMLHSIPASVLQNWRKVGPLQIVTLQSYMRKVDPVAQVLNVYKSEFSSWENDFGDQCSGMRHIKTKQVHGVLRYIPKPKMPHEERSLHEMTK